MGCIVESLCLINESYTREKVKHKILSSDIIYVGGGDTVRMMDKWKEYKAYLLTCHNGMLQKEELSEGRISISLE